MPCLADTIDLIVLIPDPFDLGTQLRIALMPSRSFGRVRSAYKLVIKCSLPADCFAIACRAMDGAIGRTLQIDSTP